MEVVGTAHRIGIDSDHRAGPGEVRMKSGEVLLDPLGTEAEHRRAFAAERAGGWAPELGVAVVAPDPSFPGRGTGRLMADHAGVAVGAGHDPAASMVGAGDVVGVTATIEEEDDLSAGGQGAGDRTTQTGAEQPGPAPLEMSSLLGEVDDLAPGERKSRGPFGQSMQMAAAGLGRVVPALEGRGR